MTITAFTNARLIDPASGRDEAGTLIVEDGRISALGHGITVPKQATVIDCKGHILAPGLVDMRSFSIDEKAAAAGGITSVILMPDQSPPLDDAAMIAQKVRTGSDGSLVRVHPMGAATQGIEGEAMAEIGLMTKAGAVGFTDGRKTIASARIMRRILDYARNLDRLVVQHAEEPTLAANGAMNESEIATRLGLSGIPTAAEAIMIERDARLVALTGARLHHAQISCIEGVDAMAGAKKRGLPMTCGVSPQYFILNETSVGDYRTFAKLSPPLRSEADRHAVVEAIRTGVIDVICSAHEPRDQDAKRLPFADAAPGSVGYETLLALSLTLYHAYDIPLMQVLAMLTVKPAELLGLECGRLEVGRPADLVIFDLDQPWRIDPEEFSSETQNTPFDGHAVQGRVLRTVLAGRTVYEDKDQ